MNKESAFVALLLFLLLFMMIGDTSGQSIPQPAPAVSPGNTFTYSFSAFFWNYSDLNATEEAAAAELVELNQTESITVTVTKVFGPVVFLNISRLFENGTETPPSEDYVNILSGSSSNAWGLIVSPKLMTNNVVYPLADFNFTINDTETMTYSFGVREAAHSSINTTSVAGTVYTFYDMYFDRNTGVMLEWYAEQVQTSSLNVKTAFLWKIKEFDLSTFATGPDYWLLTAVIVPVVAVSTVIIVFVRKRGKRRRRRKRLKK